MKSWVYNLFKALGYELTPTWRIQQMPLSSTLRKLFDALDITCVLDVGANKGQYYDFLRSHVDYKGLIISFEPIRKNAEMLQERAEHDDLWFICDYALGQKNTILPLNVMIGDSLSSFSIPDHSSVDLFREKNIVEHVEQVEIRRLDDAIVELDKIYDIDDIFLKMDTQGHDLEVFKGSNETLPRILALQTEISVIPIYKDMPEFMESLQTFTEAGYDVVGLFPVSETGVRIIEFDCVMAKRSPRSTEAN